MDPIQRLVGSVVPAATAGRPVISVDTKKMELLGCYNNAGSDYRPGVRPRRVKAQTSRTKSLAKLSRNRGYDLTDSTGRANVRVDRDTAEFCGQHNPALARQRYPDAQSLMITADCGGSNAPACAYAS